LWELEIAPALVTHEGIIFNLNQINL